MSLDPRQVPPTLADALRQLHDRTTRGFVFVRPDGTERFCSFQELGRLAERRAAALQARGLVKGDRLAIAVPDPDEFVLSFLGAVLAGVVPVPISPQLSFKNIEGYHDTVAHIANASGAALLLTTAGTRQYVEPAAVRAPMLARAGGVATVDELSSNETASYSAVAVEPTDLAFLQFTSGSTSRPKGVMVTHRNLAWNSESFMIHGLAKDSSFDKGVTWLPLFHDMGLIGFVVGTIFTDIPVVFLPTASFVRHPRVWLDKIHQHRGTITYAPNFAYALVAKRLKAHDTSELDLSCIRRAGCGAEPIQARTLRDFAAKLAPAKFDPKAFLPSYGMAEATLAITFVPHGTGVRSDVIDKKALEGGDAKESASIEDGSTQELVSCGRPFPEHEIAVVDENGARLGDRSIGQILTRGPSVSSGYYGEPELSAEAFKPGPDGAIWLYTGDLGYTVGGELFICGRLKDMIIVRGRNFYPNDLEWIVSELPSVRRGSVVAFSVDVEARDAAGNLEPASEQLVIAAEAFQSDAEALKKAISEAIVANFSLTTHDVVIVPQGTLPRTSSGKPQRRKTRQMYLDGTLGRARVLQGKDGMAGDAGASA